MTIYQFNQSLKLEMKTKRSFSLSPSTMCTLNFDNYPRDFDFIMNKEIFSVNRIIADFLSPIVRKIHAVDPALSAFEVKNEHEYDKCYFRDVIRLAEFQQVELTDENIKPLQYFFTQLGNSELMESILYENNVNSSNLKEKKPTVLTKENVFQQLRLKHQIELSVKDEINYISSHLFELESIIENHDDVLSFDLWREILSSHSICLSSEDWLFEYILQRSKKDRSFISLLEFVKLKELKTSSLHKFFSEVSLSELNSSLYSLIADLVLNTCDNVKDGKKKKSSRYFIPKDSIKAEKKEKPDTLIKKVIEFDGKNPLRGMFAYLRSKSHGSNIVDANLISITAAAINEQVDSDVRYLVDLNINSYYVSKDEENQWIKFDFRDRIAEVHCYTIKTNLNGGNDHLRNWVIEVSNNDQDYSQITREENNVTLNAPGNLVVYRILGRAIPGRYVRIRQTGMNWAQRNLLVIAQMEFFGILIEKEK